MPAKPESETTRPYKMADEIFIVMEKLRLDPVKDIRSHYALEQILKAAWNAALDKARSVSMGTNNIGELPTKIRGLKYDN